MFLFATLALHGQIYSEELRIGINREPQSLDPRRGAEVVSASLHYMLFEGLTRFNPDWSISLSIAKSIKISKNRKRYVFHLRPTYWSDGSPLTAYDFEYSWKKILDPHFPSMNAYLFFPIQNAEKAKKGLCTSGQIGIRALDEYTLVVDLHTPTPYFLDLTSFCAFFPVHHKLDLSHPEWFQRTGRDFISNGPFRLAQWAHHENIELEKNPHYWNRKKIHLQKVHIRFIVNEMTALQLFETGQLDLIQTSLCPLPPDCLETLRTTGDLHFAPAAGSMIIACNTEQFPFNNRLFRKALSLAINRKALVDHITQLGEQPARGAIPPILKKNRCDLLMEDANKEQARVLFQEALKEMKLEIEQFPSITYLYASSNNNKKIAEALQHQWQAALGIRVHLQSIEHCLLLDRLTKRNFQMAQNIWLAQYNDQMNILERFKDRTITKNYSSWEHPQFAALLQRSFYEEGEQRLATLLEAEKLLIDEMPVIPLYHLSASFLKKPYVQNLNSPYSSDLCYIRISSNR